MTYPIHTVETAPEAAKGTLTAAQKNYGFLPNLLAVMSTAPALVEAYVTLSKIFKGSSFSAAEQQIVLLTASYENNCAYCVAVHSTVSAKQRLPQHVVDAIRSGTPIADPKLEALRQFTSAVVTGRGWVSKEASDAFLSAGYGEQQVLEVVLGVGLKTISNYTTHIAGTPLDAAFSGAAWTKAA